MSIEKQPTEPAQHGLDDEVDFKNESFQESADISDSSVEEEKQVTIQDKMTDGEWLNEEDLASLDLTPEIVASYLSMKQSFENAAAKDPYDLVTDYEASQNELIRRANQIIQDATSE